MIGSTLRGELNKTGSCQTSIDNQLKTIDTFTLTVESIRLAGSAAATARVQTELDGKKVIQTVSLAHQSNGWRITAAPSV